jgi:cysteine desulfuration protein SufE
MIDNQLQEIKNNFLLFDNQLDKFEYLIEIGKSCKGIKEDNKIEKNQIMGCASKSWVICNKKNNQYLIEVDSEAHIVRGLLEILKFATNKKSQDEIIDLNGMNMLKEIGIGNSITSQRMNGFLSALNTIKSIVRKS